MTAAAVLVAVSTLLFVGACLYAGDFERYSIFTVGVFQRVTHQPAALDSHECREHWCEVDGGDGERRLWFKQIVLFGIPVASYGGGEGYYCDGHAHVGIQTGEFEEAKSVPDSVIWAIVWVVERFATDTGRPDESEFDSVQTEVTSGFDGVVTLLPVAVLVIVAAPILAAVSDD